MLPSLCLCQLSTCTRTDVRMIDLRASSYPSCSTRRRRHCVILSESRLNPSSVVTSEPWIIARSSAPAVFTRTQTFAVGASRLTRGRARPGAYWLAGTGWPRRPPSHSLLGLRGAPVPPVRRRWTLLLRSYSGLHSLALHLCQPNKPLETVCITHLTAQAHSATMSTVTGKQAAQVAAAEPEFDPTLDSWQINYARLMSHVSQVSRGGGHTARCKSAAVL